MIKLVGGDANESMTDWWLRQPIGVRAAVYILVGFMIGRWLIPVLL